MPSAIRFFGHVPPQYFCSGSVLAEQATVGNAGENSSQNRRNPEKPQLRESPTADKNRWLQAATIFYGCGPRARRPKRGQSPPFAPPESKWNSQSASDQVLVRDTIPIAFCYGLVAYCRFQAVSLLNPFRNNDGSW